MDKVSAQLLRGKKSVTEDSGGTTWPTTAPIPPMAPPGDRGAPWDEPGSWDEPEPGDEPVWDEPGAPESFGELRAPAHDLSAPAPPLVHAVEPSGLVHVELAPAVPEEHERLLLDPGPEPLTRHLVDPEPAPDCCSCCDGEHHDGSVSPEDGGGPVEFPVEPGLPALEPAPHLGSLGVPAGEGRPWERVEWPQDGRLAEPVSPEPFGSASAQAVQGQRVLREDGGQGGGSPGSPVTDPSGPLEPGEVLLREVRHDPDGAGPLAEHVTYEAVRVLPEGEQGGEPLKAGDHVMREVSGPDPDGAGPGTPVSGVETLRVLPDGWEGQRVEPVALGEAPPALRDLGLGVDPNGPHQLVENAPDGSVPPVTGRRQLLPFTPGTGRDGGSGGSTPTQPRQVAAVAPAPGSGGGQEERDEGKDEGKDEGQGEGQDEGKDEVKDEGEDEGKDEGKDDGKDEGKDEGGDEGKDEGQEEGQDEAKGEDEGKDEGKDDQGGTSGGGEQGGNVSPDPNLKFDEAAYNQLLAVVDDVRLSLQKNAAVSPSGVTLNVEFHVVPPEIGAWPPARQLYEAGTRFGESVELRNEELRKSLSKFVVALRAAREVFKETDDLAAYSADMFTSEYPDFRGGAGPGA